MSFDKPMSGLEQLAAMRAGVAYEFQIHLRQFTMRCRPLTLAETNSITGKVRSEVLNLPPEERTALAENTMLAKAYLEKCSTSSPESYDPQLSYAIMEHMTPDEIQHLYKQYVQVSARTNPSLEEISREELELLVEALKKSPQEGLATELIGLSFLQLVNLCRHLIQSG